MTNTRKVDINNQIPADKPSVAPQKPDAAAVACAKLQQAIKPKTKDDDAGLKLQRANKAAKTYCKEIFKDYPKETKKEEIDKCTEWQAHQITQCEK